jgi:Ca2+-binding RTX toxin-like protein
VFDWALHALFIDGHYGNRRDGGRLMDADRIGMGRNEANHSRGEGAEENDDAVDGGKDSVAIDGGIDSDVIDGGKVNDVIDGGKDSDAIDGGKDSDVIDGGKPDQPLQLGMLFIRLSCIEFGFE